MNKTGMDMVLSESFKELAIERPIEKITIKEITDRAGVIRPTFYNHFQDKYELLSWIIRMDLLEPCRPLISAGMIKEAMTLLFTNMGKEKAFYVKAVKMDGPISFQMVALECVKQLMFEVLTDLMKGKPSKYEWISPETLSVYYAQSMVFACEEWIKSGMAIEPAQMAEAYMFLLSHSLTDIVES